MNESVESFIDKALDSKADVAVNGEKRTVNGKPCIYYEGYWIRRYDISQATYDSYADKKSLITMLSRRVFHNTEHGINTPGSHLDAAREAYDNCSNAGEKRVNAAMLAGALLNRATDILTHVVELEKDGVQITRQNELIRQCGSNLMEALELGKQVKHFSGMEGIDEIWGEPFKAFSQPMEEFYNSRYMKIGKAMGMIDAICQKTIGTFGSLPGYEQLKQLLIEYAYTSRLSVETVKEDPEYMKIWPTFIASSEALLSFRPELADDTSLEQKLVTELITDHIKAGKELIYYITRARVPMPKSFQEYSDKCERLSHDAQRVSAS